MHSPRNLQRVFERAQSLWKKPKSIGFFNRFSVVFNGGFYGGCILLHIHLFSLLTERVRAGRGQWWTQAELGDKEAGVTARRRKGYGNLWHQQQQYQQQVAVPAAQQLQQWSGRHRAASVSETEGAQRRHSCRLLLVCPSQPMDDPPVLLPLVLLGHLPED